jgi:hypothetical protein
VMADEFEDTVHGEAEQAGGEKGRAL